MSKTNCINCGASKDTEEIKCPFCGTTYLDFTAIDFSKNEPVVCQFVMPKQFRYAKSKERVVMSMLALPMLDEISMTSDYMDITSLHDTGRYLMPSIPNIDIAITFKPMMQKDGTMFKLRDAKEDE